MENSGYQLANALVKLGFMQSVSQDNAEKLGNSGDVGIGFDGNRAERIARIKDEGVFVKVDGSLNGHSVAVKIIPMLRTSGNAGIRTKVFVGISVNALSVSGISTGMLTGADS